MSELFKMIATGQAFAIAVTALRSGDIAKAREVMQYMVDSDARIIEKRCQAAEAANANRADYEEKWHE